VTASVPLAASLALMAGLAVDAGAAEDRAALPRRVRRIVIHALGNPAYDEPARRWVFRTPPETHRLWRSTGGAHWIVWTDGSIWPRHPRPGEDASFVPGPGLHTHLARQAAPVYSHLHHGNSSSVGIELAHSGRSDDPVPPAQARALAWLVRNLLEMSRGRLTAADVYGHKDLDRRPAYVSRRCVRSGCAVFTDAEGRAYRRRVDPPESVFAALAREGLPLPRWGREDDRELRRAEAVGAGPARVGTSNRGQPPPGRGSVP
jgi:N-acetylmuramoyl-L-alanine amidase-like protein